MIAEWRLPSIGLVEENRQLAVEKIESYLQRPKETVLRDHQVDVMVSLRDFFAEGETAGYINLPTGSGKTVIITELAQALGMRTLVLSPTIQILEQTGDAAKNFSPDLSVSSYYAGKRDATGMVVNTTYQSGASLIGKEAIDPEDFDLVIADEVHTGLGENRHKIYRNFPNALFIGLTATPYFTPIEGYKSRDLVRADERWTGMFEKSIHDMSLEEAIEREILTNLDVNILKTGVRVSDIKFDNLGNYNLSDLERHLNVKTRNNLTLALIAGVENLPPDIKIPDNLKEEVSRIHEQIKGKKTAIFGISIDHIQELARLLSYAGQRVKVVHSKVDPNERRKIFKEYETSSSGIILGVDMLRLGWDSPSTQVGIYLAPTRSGIVATQELGRILRPNPGKEKAIAVQFADLFDKSFQAPVLIPNIFDPYFILRGSQIGNAVNQKQNGVSPDLDKPKITFSGIGIEAIVENAKSQELLRQRISHASLEKLDEVTSNLLLNLYNKKPDASPLELYRNLVSELPARVSEQVIEKILQALSSIDSNTVHIARRVLVSLYMKTILFAAENYFVGNEEIDSEIMHVAIDCVYENVGKIANRKTASLSSLNQLIKEGISKYIAEIENVPVTWVKDKKLPKIKRRALEIISNPSVVSLNDLSESLAEEVGESPRTIRSYLQFLMDLKKDNKDAITEASFTENSAALNFLKDDVIRVLDSLSGREREVLRLRFGIGIGDTSTMTLREVGDNLGLSGARISQIEAKALRKLRNPSRSRILKDYLDSPVSYRPFGYETSAEQRSEEFNRGQEALVRRLGMVLDPEKYQTRESRIASLYSKGLDQRTWHFVDKARRDGGITVVGIRNDILLNPEELAGLQLALDNYGEFERITVGFSDENIKILLSRLRGIKYVRYSVPLSNNTSEVIFNAKDAMNQFSIPFVIAPLKIAIELLPKEIKSQILK